MKRSSPHSIACGAGECATANHLPIDDTQLEAGGNMNQHRKLLTNRIIKLVFLVAVLFIAAPYWMRGGKEGDFKVEAHPGWARRYNAKCTLCHTTYPRLNRTGYDFKRLGYRLPKEVEARRAKGPGPTATTSGVAAADYKPYVIEPTGYKPEAATPESEKGQELYAKFNCAGCHTISGSGGLVGPPLDGVGGRRDKGFLTAHLTDPAEHARKFPELHGNQPNRMPHPHASSEEVKELVAYLRTLPEPAAGFRVSPHAHSDAHGGAMAVVDYVPAAPTDSSRAGQKLYFDMGCAACHTINKVGGQFGPMLDGIGARRSRQFIATSYLPGIEIEKEAGETKTTYEKRELVIYAAGPIGRNFSFFVQPLPLSEEKGFMGKFEMMQGLFNYGGARNFMQMRFGQIFNLRNAGFGGTDRGLTESLPFIFQPDNGFNPAGLGRGVSFEYTLGRTTTFKAFGNYNEAPEVEAGEGNEGGEGDESLVPEFRRSRVYGFVYEQVLGNKGLSGVQFQYTGGRIPFLLGDVKQNPLQFQRFSFFANKTFQDGKNFERLNAIFGVSFLRDERFLAIESEQRSRGWGYFVELDTIPIVDHLSLFARYDQLRPTTLLSDNTLRGGTFGVIFDPIKYGRMSIEYQRLGGVETANRFRIGWQLNF